jgi:PAS domain S-box-containing protein
MVASAVLRETGSLTGRAGLNLLAEVAGRITTGPDKLRACERLFELLATPLGLDVCTHYDSVDDGTLRLVAHHGLSELEAAAAPTDATGSIAGQVVRERRPLLLADVQDGDDTRADFERDIGLRSYLCLPLIVDGEVSGVVGFGRRSGTNFSDQEVDFLTAATAYVALANQRLERDRALRTTDERLRLAQEFGGVGSFEWDLLTGTGNATKGWSEIIGHSPETPPTYANLLKVVFPEDAEAFRAGLDEAMKAGSSYRAEFRIVRPDDGRLCWIRADGGILRDGIGRAVLMLGVVRDVTERRLAHERENLLMRELDHRAKNLLTIIQSVVQLTHATSIEAFSDAVSGRIQALARAHSLLASSRWEGAEMLTLANEEVAPFVSRRGHVAIDGPPVTLKPAAAQSIALVLHELVTNSAKYGALSAEGGTVALTWTVRREPADELILQWRELGGPPVAPPTREGFGTAVIHASVDRQLGGAVRYDWRPEGLFCELVLPSRQLVTADQTVGRLMEAPSPSDDTGSLPARILVVEDEPLIALQIVKLLESAGVFVVGPAASISEALELTHGENFDFALLDVDLNGSRSFPLADVLDEQRRPYAFLTSFSASELPERFHGAPVLSKPISRPELEGLFKARRRPTA